MEANATLIGTNGIVMLNAVAHVGLNLALVIHPSHAELVNTIGNAQALDEVYLVKLGVLVVFFLNGSQHLLHGLMVLGLVGETTFQVV